MTTERKGDFLAQDGHGILQTPEKLFKVNFFFLGNCKANSFCIHNLKITNLLKALPREKLEVNPFHVHVIHSQL